MVVCFMWFQDTFRFLVEDDDMDLILDEEKHMFALLEETYGVAETNTNKQLVRTNRGGGWRRVQRFMNDSEVQCYEILRMNQATFNSLCKILSEKYQLEETCHVYLEESVAMFLEMVGQDLSVRALAERYQHSSDTVNRKIDEVLSSLLKLAADIVKPERDEFASASPILVDDPRYYPFFKDCIGALDGTHVPVRPPSENADPFRGRKGEPTMNVLAICNFSMKFIYAYVGVPGRAHDTKVLTYCAKEEASFPHPPVGKYYLVDSGYPTRTGYLGPHRRTRYHLDQFVRGGPPTNSRELFNRKHSGLRSVIERTFGIWKAKWRILDRKHPKYELNKWVKIVTATMALHNFIRDSNHEDCDFSHWERVEEYEHHGDEDDHVAYVPAGDRVMEAMRDSITEEMARGRRLPY
ncbi:putative nuclease HARBI1 isoform X1 [Brassica rapa]|uniref:putative nuclease HARBI1 isoform X1 n=1 Tax=Brassica campestris TaxID=3711 RepID=UPI00142D8FD4|nr:putative nuclease HARBI1 isoform X1 [Brassica rapa]XP_033137038.1 putative nuclease HARBI1 isoform X1 [Brassica rapa]XP_048596945.1 putative nuclease HARBI1 isoform X1 [Brassica napus]